MSPLFRSPPLDYSMAVVMEQAKVNNGALLVSTILELNNIEVPDFEKGLGLGKVAPVWLPGLGVKEELDELPEAEAVGGTGGSNINDGSEATEVKPLETDQKPMDTVEPPIGDQREIESTVAVDGQEEDPMDTQQDAAKVVVEGQPVVQQQEDTKKDAEDAEIQLEDTKKDADVPEVQLEDTKKDAEDTKKDAEDAEIQLEDTKKDADVPEVQLEDTKKDAEVPEMQPEDTKEDAEVPEMQPEDTNKDVDVPEMQPEDTNKDAEVQQLENTKKDAEVQQLENTKKDADGEQDVQPLETENANGRQEVETMEVRETVETQPAVAPEKPPSVLPAKRKAEIDEKHDGKKKEKKEKCIEKKDKKDKKQKKHDTTKLRSMAEFM
eukprot:symbB.v1.2.001728.t1/scaffold61.1/size362833/27